jgi:hypothetical protein
VITVVLPAVEVLTLVLAAVVLEGSLETVVVAVVEVDSVAAGLVVVLAAIVVED